MPASSSGAFPGGLQLVLASQSPYRRTLLERLGHPFEVFHASLDESPGPGEHAAQLVERLAEQKARAYPANLPSLVIGSDQVGYLDDEILTKPRTQERAIAQLARASDSEVVFYTGLALLDSRHNGTCECLVHTTRVKFRKLSQDEIFTYVRREQPLHCCGSFQVEGLGISLTKWVKSDDPTGLIGLPLIHLCAMLRRAGLAMPGAG